jgi:hypothetical protein
MWADILKLYDKELVLNQVLRISSLLHACYIMSDGMILCLTEHCLLWFICRAGSSISAETKRWKETEKAKEGYT